MNDISLISFRDAIRIGSINNYKLSDKGFIGTYDDRELFAVAFSDKDINTIIEEIECKYMNNPTSFPLFCFKGTKLAKAFLEKHPNLTGEGYYEYVFDKKHIEIPKNEYMIKKLDLSYFDIIRDCYTLSSDDYIYKRLASGFVYGIFDKENILMGFIGEHFEGAMGMLEVFPEYRGNGIATILESYKINEILISGRVPYCNVAYDNEKSMRLQNKLGLKRISLDTWWIWQR